MGKFYDYKLKYRTFDQLLDSVSDDLKIVSDNNNIDPSNLIKVVRKINKQLGLRITKTKEVLIDFSKGVVNLPDTMENINFSVLCTFYKNVVPAIQGTVTENIDVDCTNGCTDVWLTECGDTFQIIQRVFPNLEKVFNIEKRVQMLASKWNIPTDNVYGVILNDNFMKLNVSCGKLYLNYEGILEDDDGNLLVPDHPLLNDYYEYSLKERILENMYLGGEDTERKLAFLAQKRQEAKREAYGVANLPEFQEMQEVMDINREAMYKKYYSILV